VNCAGSNRYLRIVANALRLAHFAERHHVKIVAIFSKPYRRWNLHPALAKRAERDVFLSADLGRDCVGHGDIVIALFEVGCRVWFAHPFAD